MTRGIIYLIQPVELIGTSRYKIGCSENTDLDRVKNGYKKGTRYIFIMECENPFMLEKCLKIIFNKNYKLIGGKEYFEGDEENMKKDFLKIKNDYEHIINLQNYSRDIKKDTENLNFDKIKTNLQKHNLLIGSDVCKYCNTFFLTNEKIKNNIQENNQTQKYMEEIVDLKEKLSKKIKYCDELEKKCMIIINKENLRILYENLKNNREEDILQSAYDLINFIKNK